jgi:hypothetical protein
MMVTEPKHEGAVLMSILIFFLEQFSCASVGKYKKKNIIHTLTILHFKKSLITTVSVVII